MSVRIMSLVFEYDMPDNLKTDKGKIVSDSSMKFVLLALADHCNDDGEGAYPGVRRICKKTNLSTQTVCNALNALRHNGYTTLNGKSKASTNNYFINYKMLQPIEFYSIEQGNSNEQNSGALSNGAKPSFNHQSNHHKKEEEELLPPTLTKAYENEIGKLTKSIRVEMRNELKTHPEKWIIDAIHEAAVQNQRKWSYVLGILNRWKKQGNQEPSIVRKSSHRHSAPSERPAAPKRDPERKLITPEMMARFPKFDEDGRVVTGERYSMDVWTEQQ